MRASRQTSVPDELAMHADAEIAPEEITATFLAKIEKLAPFGM